MPDDEPQGARRVVLLGASAGGVEALSTVVAGLPHDLPAAVLVVLHVPSRGTSVLPSILDRCGKLPARHAVDGEPLLPGRVYVAPPDRHMVTRDGTVRLNHNPKENGVRPSIDTLFRSAAQSHANNVVAVVLSGALDDGTAGLLSVRQHGGVAIVQDPGGALFPSMPESAARFAQPSHVVPVHEVAGLIVDYVTADPPPYADGGTRGDAGPGDPSDNDQASGDDQAGDASELHCPECGGTLWERIDGELTRFRCRVGHAYSPASLFARQLNSLEGALWAAVVALQERADLALRLARRMSDRSHHDRAGRYERQANDARLQADRVRAAILELSRSDDRNVAEAGSA